MKKDAQGWQDLYDGIKASGAGPSGGRALGVGRCGGAVAARGTHAPPNMLTPSLACLRLLPLAVLGGIDDLLQVQAADEQRGVGARISKAFASWQPAFNITQSPPGSAGLEEVAAADAVRRGIALQQDSMTSLSSVSIDEL